MSGTLLHLPSFLPLSVGSLVEWYVHQTLYRWKFSDAWGAACFTDCGSPLIVYKGPFWIADASEICRHQSLHGICGVYVPQMLSISWARGVGNPASGCPGEHLASPIIIILRESENTHLQKWFNMIFSIGHRISVAQDVLKLTMFPQTNVVPQTHELYGYKLEAPCPG